MPSQLKQRARMPRVGSGSEGKGLGWFGTRLSRRLESRQSGGRQ